MAQTQPGADPSGMGRARLLPWARRLRAVGIAVLCALVLGTHVHLGFERARHRMVIGSRLATTPAFPVELPELPALAGRPAVVIARVRGAPEGTRLTIAYDGGALTAVDLGPNDEKRIDVSVVPASGRGHTLTVAGDRAGWRLEYLEIANVHSFSDGLLGFVIVPRGYPAGGVPRWLAVLVGLELLVLGWWRYQPLRLAWRIVQDALAAVVLLAFGVLFAADLLTRYTILLSPLAFLTGMGLLYAGPLGRGLWHVARAIPPRAALVRLPHAALVVLVLWGVLGFYPRPKRPAHRHLDCGARDEPALAGRGGSRRVGTGEGNEPDGRRHPPARVGPVAAPPRGAGRASGPVAGAAGALVDVSRSPRPPGRPDRRAQLRGAALGLRRQVGLDRRSAPGRSPRPVGLARTPRAHLADDAGRGPCGTP